MARRLSAGNSWSEVKEALVGALPVGLSYIPLAMVFGALARATGLTLAEAAAMSLLIYSGAAQLLAAQMLAGGAAYGGILVAGAVLALRHVLMGASVARFLKGVPLRIKAAMALFLTDESFALALGRYQTRPESHVYFIAVNLALYASWNAGTIVGFALGHSAGGPPSIDLGIIFPLLFLAIVVQMAKTPIERGAAIGGVAIALGLRHLLPAAWIVLIAALGVGIACALIEERSTKPNADAQHGDEAT